MRRIQCIPVTTGEVEGLSNMYLNRWPAERIMQRRAGKWQFRIPIEEVTPAASLRSTVGNEAIFFDPANRESRDTYAIAPVEIGDLLWLDEPMELVEVESDLVTARAEADGRLRTVRAGQLAARLSALHPGEAIPSPLPELLASAERIRVRDIKPQKLSTMTLADYEAEAAPISNYAGRGRYLRDASVATGFAWQVWAEKFPRYAGVDAWAWVIAGERVAI